MGHKPRLRVPGLYHVTTRSNAEEVIFRDSGDFAALATEVARTGLCCHWFCAMPTHYHLLVAVGEGELAAAVHLINRRHASAFNKRYGRRGHVFDSPYTANLVDSEQYLINLVVYLACNPPDPEIWQWSSYPGFLGLRPQFSFVDTTMIARILSPTALRAETAARRQGQNLVRPAAKPGS